MGIFSTMSFYQMGIYFLIYAFIGWCIEVVYYSVSVGRFVNRGFLSGPLCPIYGFGALSVILLLTPLTNSILLLFASSVVLCTLVELSGGIVLNKLFHARWWDYSDEPFNVGGYICLKFSLLWGVACVLLMLVIHPFISGVVSLIPSTVELIILFLLYALLVVDIVLTVIEVRHLHKDLGELTLLQQSLHLPSDLLAEKLGSGAIAVSEKLEALHLEEKGAAFAQQVLHIQLPDISATNKERAMSANAATAGGPQFDAPAAGTLPSGTENEVHRAMPANAATAGGPQFDTPAAGPLPSAPDEGHRAMFANAGTADGPQFDAPAAGPLPSAPDEGHRAMPANAATADGPQFDAQMARPSTASPQSEADSRIFHILHNHKPARKRLLTAFPKAKNSHYPEALQQMLDSNAAKSATKNRGKHFDNSRNLRK